MIDLNIDELQLYIGDDYVINDKIKIKQPKISDIAKFGEEEFFSVVHTICAIPSDMKSVLWDMKIDWTLLDDYELFMLFCPTLSLDKTSILFGDLNFEKLKPYKSNINGEPVLADKESGIIVDKMIYLRIVTYLRKAFNIKPKIEKAANEMTKKVLIDEDRSKRAMNKDKPFKSYLLPLISAVKVKQKYTKDYILNMGYVEFFDDLSRIQVINNSDHLMSGVYAGTVDLKKINKDELNWLKELS